MHSRRRQHAKAKDMFERNFVISRKMVNARQGGATTGTAYGASIKALHYEVEKIYVHVEKTFLSAPTFQPDQKINDV